MHTKHPLGKTSPLLAKVTGQRLTRRLHLTIRQVKKTLRPGRVTGPLAELPEKSGYRQLPKNLNRPFEHSTGSAVHINPNPVATWERSE